MGIAGAIKVHKYGYYPKGMGEVLAELKPIVKLSPIRNEKFGTLTSIEGVSVCTRLSNRRVAERQAKAANEFLMGEGYPKAEIKVVNDYSNPLQKGSSLVLWARTSTGSLLGGDAIGELRKSSEDVGREAARKLVQEMGTKATFDIHLADLLIPYMALAEDNSVFLTRLITDHLETNIWLAEKFLDVKFQIQKTGNLFKVEKKES
jgi:RNA 3'-terminal phosphate cyclase (ATP)